MAGRIILEITSGSIAGQRFEFDSHDAFLFGRDPDCHARIVNDRRVSRHHFILETNPPAARIRDLGSMNGTFVNGIRLQKTCVEKDSDADSPNPQSQRDLSDGDVIKVGGTRIRVSIEVPIRCPKCGATFLPGTEGPPRCSKCATTIDLAADEASCVPRCASCQKEITGLVLNPPAGTYRCSACTSKLAESANELKSLLKSWSIKQKRTKARSHALANYQFDKILGKGGMGAVFRARIKADPTQFVAVKVMAANLDLDPMARQRFVREVQLGLGVRHRSFVKMLSHGVAEDVFFIVMEYCRGGDLEKLLLRQKTKLPIGKANQIMLKCTKGMEFAHGHKLVHRDLKPSNILLQKDARGRIHPKISDFGLAKSFQLAGISGMTATGTFGGSWYYMPREQVTDFKFVEPVSDVWALGAIYFRMLTGQNVRTFSEDRDPIEVVLEQEIIPIRKRDPDIPLPIAEIVDKALICEPSQRFQNAGEMRQALEKVV